MTHESHPHDPWRRPEEHPKPQSAPPSTTPRPETEPVPGAEQVTEPAHPSTSGTDDSSPSQGDAPVSKHDTTQTTHPDQPGAEPPRAEPERSDLPARSHPPSSATSQKLPFPMPPVIKPPLRSAYGQPPRFSSDANTGQFQLALPPVKKITTGPAVGSLLVGIAALLVSMVLACQGRFNFLVTLAFCVLTLFLSGASVLLSGLSFRQLRRGVGEYKGKGMAIAGLSCGLTAIGLMALLLAITF